MATFVMVANAGNNTVLREGKTVDGLYSKVKDVCGYCRKIIIFNKDTGAVKYEWDFDNDEIVTNRGQFSPNCDRAMTENETKLYRWAKKWHPEME